MLRSGVFFGMAMEFAIKSVRLITPTTFGQEFYFLKKNKRSDLNV